MKVIQRELGSKIECLDLLYDKETSAKLLTFKLKYLISHAALLSIYE